MGFCSTNGTLAVLNFDEERILKIINSNELIGFLGKIIDNFLVKKHRRKCTLIIGYDFLSDKLGNLGLIENRKAEIYLKSEVPIIDENFIHYSFPFSTEKYMIYQDITKESNIKINDMLNNLNFGFILSLCFILSAILSLIISILLELIINKNDFKINFKKIKNNLIKKLFRNQWKINSSLTIVGLFLLFYQFHLWFVRQIALNSIKTNKVLVDTSVLIKTKDEALSTEKTCCFLAGETELSIAKNSPSSNILRRLYEDKTFFKMKANNINTVQENRCILAKKMENANAIEKLDGIFGVSSETALYIAASLVGNTKQNLVVWFNSIPILEMNSHLIIRNEKSLINRFNKIIIKNAEIGLHIKFANSFKYSAVVFHQFNKVFITSKDYVDDNNTKSERLNVENFKTLFLLYFLACSIVLLINILIIISRK